jgi:hypothetical protein
MSDIPPAESPILGDEVSMHLDESLDDPQSAVDTVDGDDEASLTGDTNNEFPAPDRVSQSGWDDADEDDSAIAIVSDNIALNERIRRVEQERDEALAALARSVLRGKRQLEGSAGDGARTAPAGPMLVGGVSLRGGGVAAQAPVEGAQDSPAAGAQASSGGVVLLAKGLPAPGDLRREAAVAFFEQLQAEGRTDEMRSLGIRTSQHGTIDLTTVDAILCVRSLAHPDVADIPAVILRIAIALIQVKRYLHYLDRHDPTNAVFPIDTVDASTETCTRDDIWAVACRSGVDQVEVQHIHRGLRTIIRHYVAHPDPSVLAQPELIRRATAALDLPDEYRAYENKGQSRTPRQNAYLKYMTNKSIRERNQRAMRASRKKNVGKRESTPGLPPAI